MNASLEKILFQLRGEQKQVLFVERDTLENMLKEMAGMCFQKQGGGITVEKRQGHTGYVFSLASSDAPAAPYVMGSQSTSGGGAVAHNDTWTAAGGGTTNGTDAVAGAFDGVKLDTARAVATKNEEASPLEHYDNNSNFHRFDVYNVTVFKRALTFSSSGMLATVSAESSAGTFYTYYPIA